MTRRKNNLDSGGDSPSGLGGLRARLARGDLRGGLAFTAGGLFFIVLGLWLGGKSVCKSLAYLPVTATVDKVEGGTDADDYVTVTYSYVVAGRRYTGEDSAREDEKSKFRALRSHAWGQTLTVYHDPRQPGESLVRPGGDITNLAIVTFALPFLGLGLCMIWPVVFGGPLVAERAINKWSDKIPGGGMGLVFLGTCVAGTVAQAILMQSLNWRWGLAWWAIILFVGVPGANLLAYRVLARRRARQAAADEARRSKGNTAGLDDEEVLSSDIFAWQMAGGIIGTLILCTVVGVFASFAVTSLWKCYYASVHYAATEGAVIRSAIKAHSGSDGDTTYSPDIRYAYRVGGKEYVGRDYDFGGGSTNLGSYADTLVGENPAGKKVTVYYDPDAPAAAVLSLTVSGLPYLMLLIIQPFILLAIWLVGWTASLPARHRRIKSFLAKTLAHPWRIPQWGIMHERVGGWTIVARRGLAGPAMSFTWWYSGACLAGVIVLLAAPGGLTRPDPALVQWILCLGALAGAVAAGRKLIFPRGHAVEIDTDAKTISVRTCRRAAQAKFESIKALRLRKVQYPGNLAVNNERTRFLLMEAVAETGNVPLRAFKWHSHMPETTIAIAARVRRELAAIMDVEAAKGVSLTRDTEGGSGFPWSICQFVRNWHADSDYSDLT